MNDEQSYLVSAELVAVITAVLDDTEATPAVLTTAAGDQLPAGPLQRTHRSMQEGMRAWVREQTGLELGYIEQLYTFSDRDRGTGPALEVSYLGLTTAAAGPEAWRSWYDFLPWEDRRDADSEGRSSTAGSAAGSTAAGSAGTAAGGSAAQLADALQEWAASGPPAEQESRRIRTNALFGLEDRPWRPELALARYELLYEAGLIPEAGGDAHPATASGAAMVPHHRRILASGIARLRSKIQYQPVVFELLAETFTLSQLQAAVEAIAGQRLHTQNFRRLVAAQQLVEDSGQIAAGTGGRPAKLMRFRRAVLDARAVAGTKLPIPRVR